MKRPTFVNTRLHEDAADAYSTTAPNSGNTHIDGGVSPYIASNDANLSDCDDSYSDSSRRMRKKRNTYQKIPDDIRMQLLEAVQNGETLKAAAKRHKINYSSAKSILHTYRKEGRILKKSAQERTTKKRSLPTSEFEQSTKASKQAKKENTHTAENDYPYAQSYASTNKKVKCEPSNNTGEEASFRNPKKVLVENSSNSKFYSDNQPLTLTDNVHKEDESTMRMLAIIENEHPSHPSEVNHQATAEPAYKDENSVHKFKLFDNFYFNHHYETPTEHIFGDNADYLNHMNFTKEFDPFHDQASNAIRKASTHENDHHFGFDEKNTFVPNGFDFEMSAADPNCPFKSFMDTQRLLRDALRKASFTSFNGKYGGYRKGSVDFL